MTARLIAGMLAERVDQLVADLLPAGHREGHEWRCGSVAGEAGDSLGVHLTGAKAAVWSDFATGAGGDALDLVRAVLGLDMPAALDWSRRWLGIDDGVAVPRRQASPPAPAREVPHLDDEARARQDRSLDIWRSATKDIAGTPAELNLRARGLEPAQLFSLHGPGRWPATMRYAERAAMDPTRECRALVIAVHGADCGLVRAVHRILLHADGRAVRDERGKKRKLALGPIAGNAARFDYWPDATGRWGTAEGCESALAAYALTGIPTWAAVSAGNMARVVPPSWARHVTIFADRDPAGMGAAAEALRRFQDLPKIATVRVVGAVAEGEDAADALERGRPHAR